MGAPPKSRQPLWQLMGRLFRAHPWHGVRLGDKGSDVVTCYIEITPSDTEKFGSLESLLDAAMKA